MQKQLPILLFLSTIFFTACDPDVNPKESASFYSDGVLIINEGNFGSADGDLSFYKTESDSVYQNIFEAENSLPFAGSLQSVRFDDDLAYLVDNLGQIEIVNGSTFKSVETLEGYGIPRDFAIADGKGFIADWGPYDDSYNSPSSYISVIDINTYSEIDSISIASQPERILVIEKRIFIASVASEIITVIDATDLSFETITVPYGPSEMVIDKNNQIWVLCSGELVSINPNTLEVENTIDLRLTDVDFTSGDLVIDKTGDNLYYMISSYNEDWTTSNSVYSISISANNAPANSLVTGTNLYGIGISPENELFIADHKNYAGNGEVRVYNLDGELQKTLKAGRVPSGFIFLP